MGKKSDKMNENISIVWFVFVFCFVLFYFIVCLDFFCLFVCFCSQIVLTWVFTRLWSQVKTIYIYIYIYMSLSIIYIFCLHIFCWSFRIAVLILWYSAGIGWCIFHNYFTCTFCPTLGHHQGRIYYKSNITFVCTLLLWKKSVCTVAVCSVYF